MKKALLLVLSVFVVGMSSCSTMKNKATTEMVTLTGAIEEAGMTTYQYGTHKIKAEDKTYALKSSKINLNDYTDKSVTIKGTKVSGYPLEGGPELIEVLEISEK